jgi:hypothetical protein
MPWAARLLAVACVSLAAKMEEYRAPALSEFRAGVGDDGYEFSCVCIRRMELLVLSTLDWRMAAVTPFDYLPCLSSRLRRHVGGGGGAGASAALIFSAAEAASVLDHRPSTVAAAAVLAATHGALTREALESKMSGLSPSFLLDKVGRRRTPACSCSSPWIINKISLVLVFDRSGGRVRVLQRDAEPANFTGEQVDDDDDRQEIVVVVVLRVHRRREFIRRHRRLLPGGGELWQQEDEAGAAGRHPPMSGGGGRDTHGFCPSSRARHHHFSSNFLTNFFHFFDRCNSICQTICSWQCAR